MTLYYLDASAIVKRYRRNEQGADFIWEFVEGTIPGDRFYTSFLSIIEVTSAIVRQTRDPQSADEILARFEQDSQSIFLPWPLDNEIVGEAVYLAEQHKLRAGDAIHLATAIHIAAIEADSLELVMVSSDRELLRASNASNLLLLDPLDDEALDRLNHMRSASR